MRALCCACGAAASPAASWLRIIAETRQRAIHARAHHTTPRRDPIIPTVLSDATTLCSLGSNLIVRHAPSLLLHPANPLHS